MTVLFSVTISLLIISWFIEYPDVLPAKVIITTSTPPITLVSRSTGSLVVLKKDNDEIKRGEIMAYLQTNTSPQAVLELEKGITKSEGYFPITRSQNGLGDLEQDYSSFAKSSLDLKLFVETSLYDVQIKQLERQKTAYQELDKNLNFQKRLALQELALASEKFKIDSVLFGQGVNSVVDFNKDKSIWLQQQKAFRNVEAALVNNQIQVNQLEKQIIDLRLQETETKQKLEAGVISARKSLLAQIKKWKQTFLFTAPQDGRVAYIGFKENEMFIDGGQAVFSVLPVNDTLIAKAELPLYNSGKVEAGQRVNIRLENYPFHEYGTITGTVSSISTVPSDGKYFVNIVLPQGLKTSHGQKLEFRQQLIGTTEIITEELKLIERVLYQFRRIVSLP